VKLIPRRNQAIGRIVVKRIMSFIVRPDETKNTTKFVLIDAVGAVAEAAGIRVGDIVLPGKMGNILLDGGASFRPLLDEEDIRAWATDVNLSDLVVQTDNGSGFVSFDAKDAAQPLGDMGEREWTISRDATAAVAVGATNGSTVQEHAQ
jgi:hypothetical protein